MHTIVGILGDVAGVSADNAAAGIRGRAAAVNIFTNVCGPRALALGCMRQTAVQEFADWSGNACSGCMPALRLRWAELPRMCGSIAHACVQSRLHVVWVSQLGVCGGVVNASRCNEMCFECKLLLR